MNRSYYVIGWCTYLGRVDVRSLERSWYERSSNEQEQRQHRPAENVAPIKIFARQFNPIFYRIMWVSILKQ